MPITTDLGSPIGQLRLLIGDTSENEGVKPNGGNFTDEELTYFYEKMNQNLEGGAALACETLAWLWHTHPDVSADGLTVRRSQIAHGWWRAAVRFRAARGASLHLVKRGEGLDDAA